MAGQQLELQVGPVAHGGWCVARHEDRVVFVRHALPGEHVLAQVTDVGRRGRFLRADVVAVRRPSPDRVEPPCPYALDCGGCDWQHAALPAQRALKSQVVTEQLRRLAGIDRVVNVEPVPGDRDGLGWRTRVRFAVAPDGRAAFRRHRSHSLVPVDHCLIAHPLVDAAGIAGHRWEPGDEMVVAAVPASRQVVVRSEPPATAPPPLHQRAAGRGWRVSGGFWQVHPGAPDLLVAAVGDLLRPRPGEHLLDLYAGVGLFGGTLGGLLGPGGRVDAVEADPGACEDAAANLVDLPWVRVHQASVLHHLRRSGLRRVDLVVLDPPRTGAGREVVERVAALGPRAVCYVACDPAGLARDLAVAAAHGYRLADLRAFDLFPMTHHVECVALLTKTGSDPQ